MFAEEAYVLARNKANKYTDESIQGISGVLAGKNCTIKSSEHKDGVTTIVFQWVADNGNIRETTIQVFDGTPIYDYTPGKKYHYGDIVIYEAQLYKCITEHVAGPTLDPTKYIELGSPDGNYDIVSTKTDLPPRFTSADRKLYYVIDEASFYLWDGSKWELQEKPITSEELAAMWED